MVDVLYTYYKIRNTYFILLDVCFDIGKSCVRVLDVLTRRQNHCTECLPSSQSISGCQNASTEPLATSCMPHTYFPDTKMCVLNVYRPQIAFSDVKMHVQKLCVDVSRSLHTFWHTEKLLEDRKRSGNEFWCPERTCEVCWRFVPAFWHPERLCDLDRCSVHAIRDPKELLYDGRRLFWHPEKLCVDFGLSVHVLTSIKAILGPETIGAHVFASGKDVSVW